MEKTIGVGYEDFDELIQDHHYYVDKTQILFELAAKAKNKVTLFTRPRRFGKTLMMSMMESFFDIRRDSRAVFAGLDIMKRETFCAEWMNRYPVIFISLKDAEGLDFDGAAGMLKAILANFCKTGPACERSSEQKGASSGVQTVKDGGRSGSEM